jgi:hypothetical protein
MHAYSHTHSREAASNPAYNIREQLETIPGTTAVYLAGTVTQHRAEENKFKIYSATKTPGVATHA